MSTASLPPVHDRRFLHGDVKFKYVLGLALTFSSYQAVEMVSGAMVPITCRQFTDSAFILSIIVSLNAVFGFVAQPYVSWKSDHTLNRWGRRRPFLLLGFSGTMLSTLAVGMLPYLITGEARHTYWALAIVLAVNVAMQMFQDVCNGAIEPLMGDTFRQEQLGRAVAIRNYLNIVAGYSISMGAMSVADRHPWVPYVVCASWTFLSILLTIFLVRDRPVAEGLPPAQPYRPWMHFKILAGSSDLRRLTVICSLGLMVPSAMGLFNSLYLTEQLGFALKDLAAAAAFTPVVTLVLAFPIGLMVDRVGPKYLIALGFLVLASVAWGLAYHCRNLTTLMILANLNHAGNMLIWGSISSMVFQYATDKERGKVFGVVQFVRAIARFAITLGLGLVVQYSVSFEPTPYYAADLKKPTALFEKLLSTDDPVAQLLRARLGGDTLALIEKVSGEAGLALSPEEKKKQTEAAVAALVQDFNRIVAGEVIYDEEIFRAVSLSKQARALLADPELGAEERLILNRVLIADAFSKEISRKINYRATYVCAAALALLGAYLALTSRRGVNARTMKEARAS